MFRDIVKDCTNVLCGVRRVGWQRRNWSEWWGEEIGAVVAEKRKAFEEWLPRRDRVTCGRYRAQSAIVKQTVKVATRTADWQWGERLGNDFESNDDVLERVNAGEEG